MIERIARTPLARWLRELIARDPLFASALGAGTVLRLMAMIGYPGALWFAGDSYIYVNAALRLQPDLSKTVGYSLFLWTLLPFHSFALVAGVQHLMGLAIAVMVYLLARRAGVPKRWATAATLPVLLDGFEIEDEHMIMAEALFTFLVMLAMLAILWRKQTFWPVALGAGLLVGYAVTVRSEGLPILILFPVFMMWRGWRTWRGWLATAALTIGCAAPVVAYAAWFHDVNHTWNLTQSEGFYAWGRVSSFAECSVIKPPADLAALCPSGPPSSRTAPGDYIWHAPQLHQNLAGSPVSPANNTRLEKFAIRAVLAQPVGYLGSVFDDLLLSVEWPRHKYPDAGTVSYYYFRLQPQVLPADPKNSSDLYLGRTAYSGAVSYGHASPSTVVEPFAALIALYERIFYTWGPLFGIIMLMGLGGVVRIEGIRERQPRLAWSRRAGSMLPWVTAVVLLVFPIATADFDYRYLLPVLPFAGLAAGLAFAPARVRGGRPVPPPTVPHQDDLPSQVPGSVS